MVTADLEGRVDNARMREITSEHPTDTTRLLQKLISKGALIQDGQGRWTTHHLPAVVDSVQKGVNLGHKDIDSLHNNEIPDNEW